MQYMLLIYNEPGGWDTMTPEQQQSVYARVRHATPRSSGRAGKLLAGDELQPITTATTVQVRDGETLAPTGRSPRRRKCSAATT